MVHVFFFNDTATTEIYTLSLHDALPILRNPPAARPAEDVPLQQPGLLRRGGAPVQRRAPDLAALREGGRGDRKSTRLNSSHANISYAVFCLKKKQPTCTSLLERFPYSAF